MKMASVNRLTCLLALVFACSNADAIGQSSRTTPVSAGSSTLIEGKLQSKLVPSPVEYYVLLPKGYDRSNDPLPLVLNLHGGGGDRRVLQRQKPMFDQLWDSGELPEMVIVTPSVSARGFYMNYKSGAEKWEDFIIGPFLEHLRKNYHATRDPKKTFIAGISMGGMGSLRIAFKHPEKFAAVAGMEPGIEPILRWRDMRPKHRFWRSDDLFEKVFGKPVDPAYWAANNPASIVAANATKIRHSGLQIYLEAGDEDEFWLYEGTEFLHQTLWNNKIKHEYHLVRGAGHVDSSLRDRTIEAYQFLARTMDPWKTPKQPTGRNTYLQYLERMKARLNEKDHYHIQK